ncbi:hypothetical protein HDU85_003491 [Gaertneriomyces sp. JEL0708]|nr:hypothetical protein HDU85_003491 [Gaertneriomyces sp. JEL0708]
MTTSLFVAAFLWLCSGVQGFDTGPHNDITRNVLELYGYSTPAQQLAALTNWFTDVYAFSFSLAVDIRVIPKHLPELEQSHDNNLYSIIYGANYIAQHTVNTRAAIQQVAATNDVVGYLALLGTSVHTVQDFYAHSNWASLRLRESCGCYGIKETVFDGLVESDGDIAKLLETRPWVGGYSTYMWEDQYFPNYNVHSGIVEHGGYCSGINHDSPVRPYFEESISYALSSTLEWVYNVEKWASAVNPDIVANAKQWQPASDADRSALDKNFREAFEVSYSTTAWVFGEDDGHWKGAGSGDFTTFTRSVTSFSSDQTPFTTLYTRDDNPIFLPLVTPSPYAFLNNSVDPQGFVVANRTLIRSAIDGFTPFTRLPGNITDLTAVVVRTQEFDIGSEWVSLFDDPDPYASVSIDSFEVREAPASDTQRFTPYWTAMKYIPVSTETVDLTYTLIDAAAASSQGDIIALSAEENKSIKLRFNVSSKAVEGLDSGYNVNPGVYDSKARVLRHEYRGTSVSLYFDARPLKCPSNVEPNWATFCPNSAFTEVGVFKGCDGSRLAATTKSAAMSLHPTSTAAWLIIALAATLALLM